MDLALDAAKSICEREPRNPWGWLRLSDLHAEAGDGRAAKENRERARAIVPRLAV